MKIQAIKTRVFVEGENLEKFVLSYLPTLSEKSIVIVTSKIIALAEGRTGKLEDKQRLIKKESAWSKQTKHTWLTVKDGMFMANAGIDESNADGKLILLPRDSFEAAQKLRKNLRRKFKVKKLGVLITDSRTMPLRAGVVGVALGYVGFRGLRDYRNRSDIFGRKLKITQTNVADSLATAATLVMGEGREQTPLGVITSAPVDFLGQSKPEELKIAIDDDMYRPLLII
jgi:coenzyme F420-0:L-glutamate ligase